MAAIADKIKQAQTADIDWPAMDKVGESLDRLNEATRKQLFILIQKDVDKAVNGGSGTGTGNRRSDEDRERDRNEIVAAIAEGTNTVPALTEKLGKIAPGDMAALEKDNRIKKTNKKVQTGKQGAAAVVWAVA